MKETSYGVCFYKIERKKIFIFLNKTSKVSDWNFFKGKQEYNETKEDTAIREIAEETGLIITKKMLEDYFFVINKRKNIGIFLIDSKNINFNNLELQKEEIYTATWIDIIYNIKMSKNQKELFLKISSRLYEKHKWFKIIKIF